MVQSAQQIMEILQLLLILVVDVPVVRVVQVLRCCRGEDLGAPTVAAHSEIRLFLRPFVFGSHLFGVRLEYRILDFSGC